ncbi:MAG: methyltransferase family protein [Pseudomonadota bacterium]
MSAIVKKTFFGTRMRLATFWLVSLFALYVLIAHPDPWLTGTLTGRVLALVGVVLTVIGIVGRGYCAVHIAGRKLSGLVTDGPYSLTRNPLYLFSLIGGIGIGLGGQNLYVLGLMLLAFALYYPGVMLREQRLLAEAHGEAFEAYRRETPFFFPRFSGFHEPRRLEVKPKSVRRNMIDTVYFSVVYALFALVATLHAHGVLGG